MAFEALAVATVMPAVSNDLEGLHLYGWTFSAFFLGSLLGIVAAGRAADRSGPAPPFAVGLSLFAIGLVLGGLAPTMVVLVGARAVQGFGAGAVPAIAYVSIGRGYPDALRPRVFAYLSTAWVLPGLAGPVLAGAVADSVGWRWVFLGLVPLVAVAAVLTLRPLVHLGTALSPTAPTAPTATLARAFRVAVGAGLVLAGLDADIALVAAGLVLTGLILGLPALRALAPPGTLRGRPGLPAAVGARGVLTFAFFGADAYVSLALTSVRGTGTAAAGLALTAAALTWTVGAWLQARFIARVGARRLVRCGFVGVLAGNGAFALGLVDGVPLAVAVLAWGAAGLGMGLAYSPISVTVLREAAPGQEGAATSAVQLFDVVGVALGTGVGGAVVAAGAANGWAARSGLLIVLAITATVAVLGWLLARRLPALEPAPRGVRHARWGTQVAEETAT